MNDSVVRAFGVSNDQVVGTRTLVIVIFILISILSSFNFEQAEQKLSSEAH